MKKQTIYFQAITVFITMALTLAGCQHTNTQQNNIVTKNLTAEKVADTLFIRVVFEDSVIVSSYEAGAEVDYPIGGPQPLTDSVRQFVKRELYNLFDWDNTEANAQEEIHIPFQRVCEWNGENIVTDFVNNYRPLYEKEDMFVGAVYLNLLLMAQTETFVTYYAQHIHCGASCNSEYSYHTFRKRDGHLLKEVLNKKGIMSFLKAYPQYKDVFLIGDEDLDYFTFSGLFDDGLHCSYLIVSDWPDYNPEEGWHEIIIPYAEIKPYLSKEAQELIMKA